MNYLQEKISLVASLMSFAFMLTAFFVMLPPKAFKYLLGAAIVFLVVSMAAGAYVNFIYGWDF